MLMCEVGKQPRNNAGAKSLSLTQQTALTSTITNRSIVLR